VSKIGLIAGNGIFPLEVARAARRRGLGIIAIAHSGETDPALSTFTDEITWIKVGELQRMIEAFRSAGVKEAAMAGGISRARLGDSFAPDARAMAMLSRIGRFSDDTVLRAVAGEIEAEGIAVIDPVPMLENILAEQGACSRTDALARPTRRSAGCLRNRSIGRQVRRRPGGCSAGRRGRCGGSN
jgi:DUF1009 family protein